MLHVCLVCCSCCKPSSCASPFFVCTACCVRYHLQMCSMRIGLMFKCCFLQPFLGSWPLVSWARSRRRTEAAMLSWNVRLGLSSWMQSLLLNWNGAKLLNMWFDVALLVQVALGCCLWWQQCSSVLTIRYSLCIDDQHQLTLVFFVFGLCTIKGEKSKFDMLFFGKLQFLCCLVAVAHSCVTWQAQIVASSAQPAEYMLFNHKRTVCQ